MCSGSSTSAAEFVPCALRDTAGGRVAQRRPRKPLDDVEGHDPAQLELYFRNLFLATVRRGIWARTNSSLNEDKCMDEGYFNGLERRLGRR